MEFSASYDTFAKLLTAGVLILFICIGYWNFRALKKSNDSVSKWIRITILVILVFTAGYSFLYHPKSYTVKRDELIIKRQYSNVYVNMKDILDCRVLTEADMKGTIRTFGVGGLFGYFGHYHNPMVGEMTFYATSQDNLVLVHTSTNGTLVLSPDQPEQFAKEIMDDIVPNN